MNDGIKLVLCMIIKNESKIIKRCFDTVRPIVDALAICDTGSTDDTVDIVDKYIKDHNIPGKIFHHSWENFGHNRSLSFDACKELAQQLGYDLNKTFALLSDADMCLEIDDKFNKNKIDPDFGSYSITQYTNTIEYGNTRLLRLDLPWKCVGRTHEYWDSGTNIKKGHLNTLRYDDRNDGGCKSDKYERDVKLLNQDLQENPKNVRSMFYLAQSYKGLRQWDKSIEWYKKRIEAGGWDQEIYYSYYMIGQCYEEKDDWSNALKWYLDGYNYRPSRVETIYKIVEKYRKIGKHVLAYQFLNWIRHAPITKDSLFVSTNIQKYLIDYELSILCYYMSNISNMNKKQLLYEGFKAGDRYLLNRDSPVNVNRVMLNQLFYMEPLPGECININFPLSFDDEESKLWTRLNPSICQFQTKQKTYLVNCRIVNYRYGDNKWVLNHGDGQIRTKNCFLLLNENLGIKKKWDVIDLDYPKNKRNIHGYEDLRVFIKNNEIWGSSTTFDASEDNKCKITLSKFYKDDSGDNVVFRPSKTILFGTNSGINEKNWCPFEKDGKIMFVYSVDPFIILQYDEHDKEGFYNDQTSIYLKKTFPYDMSRFRGGSQLISFELNGIDGYLWIIHEVSMGKERIYTHRFLWISTDWNTLKWSLPFYMESQGIEFVAGLCKSWEKGKLIITYGKYDKEAKIKVIDENIVIKYLNM